MKMQKLIELVKKQQLFLIYLILGLAARFININNNLFFTWDQGRDAWKFAEIISGNLTLIGPTSGISGFFLGPLWFYLGVPGYLWGSGNPYLISYWLIFLSCLALPIFWYLAFLLFPAKSQKGYGLLTAFLLAFVPGSIQGSTFVWNPMIGLPLVALAVVMTVKARQSRLFLGLSFLSWALVLQSEFAYAIFFVVCLFLLIPWIRKKIAWQDYLVSILAVALTGIPQLLFELKNNWLLTKSLLTSMTSDQGKVPFVYILSHRPKELLWSSYELLFRTIPEARVFMLLLIPLLLWGIIKIFKGRDYQWKMMAVLGIIPYVFYMFWRGNYGNFFDYYVTPHFILLVPLIVFSLAKLIEKKDKNRELRLVLVGLIIGWLVMSSINLLALRINKRSNGAGIRAMENAMGVLFLWQQRDGFVNQSAFQIFTPNSQTEHYDFMMHYLAKKRGQGIPSTVKNDDLLAWYVLIEPDNQLPEKRFTPWYEKVAQKGIRTRSIKVGDLIVETWIVSSRAQENGLLEVTSAIDFIKSYAYPGVATPEEAAVQLEN